MPPSQQKSSAKPYRLFHRVSRRKRTASTYMFNYFLKKQHIFWAKTYNILPITPSTTNSKRQIPSTLNALLSDIEIPLPRR